MKKRITANLYTETKTVWRNRQHITISNENGALFSRGEYKPKIFPSDLPEWFVEGNFYRHRGYLSAKGVKYLIYRPNKFSNHMFKDDFLYISYDKHIVPAADPQSVFKYDGLDEYIWGWNIVRFLKAAEKYSSYDISQIKEQIEQKRKWFEETFPKYYEIEGPKKPIFSYCTD